MSSATYPDNKKYYITGSIVVGVAITWGWFSSSSSGIIIRPKPIYDFIIVGGGTAGCVLASRLSETEQYQVLLIEAGPEEPWHSNIPLSSPLLQKSRFDWAYTTLPQKKSSSALHNKESHWPRGKVLGGSSQMNFNIHSFGLPSDFDRWCSKLGVNTWNLEHLQKYADRAECFRLKPLFSKTGECSLETDCDTKHRRKKRDGVHCYHPAIRKHVSSSNLTNVILAAGKELGLPVGNLNRNIDYGASVAETTVFQGKRWSPVRGYLRPAMGRPNLHIMTDSFVRKIIMDGRRAIGVEFFQWNKENFNGTVFARAEVILSAGSINTPTLLMQSGIGPPEVLHKHKIPVAHELTGVGQNLADHLNVPLYVSLQSHITLNPSNIRTFSTFWNYFVNGKGNLAEAAIEGIAAVPVGREIPEIGLVAFNMGFVDKSTYSNAANIKPKYFDLMFPGMKNENSSGFILLASCLQPKSRGYVTISGSDPKAVPIIQPNYLHDQYDIRCMRDAIRISLRLIATKAFKSVGASLTLPEYPECRKPSQENNWEKYEEFLTCIIRVSALTGYHPVGTSQMGSDDDPQSVVDHELRVIGIDRLRVVDASIFPTPVSGGPSSVVIITAEKAADLIKDSWPKKSLSTQRICSSSDDCQEIILRRLENKANNILPTALVAFFFWIPKHMLMFVLL